jgi:hypothetical protein
MVVADVINDRRKYPDKDDSSAPGCSDNGC